jgi:hypothetical protein
MIDIILKQSFVVLDLKICSALSLSYFTSQLFFFGAWNLTFATFSQRAFRRFMPRVFAVHPTKGKIHCDDSNVMCMTCFSVSVVAFLTRPLSMFFCIVICIDNTYISLRLYLNIMQIKTFVLLH